MPERATASEAPLNFPSASLRAASLARLGFEESATEPARALGEVWRLWSWRRISPVIAAVCLVVGLCTGLSWLAFERTDLVNPLMLYVLGSTLCAFFLGRLATVLAACISIAAYDYYFVPPRFSLAVTDLRYLVTFGSLLIVSLVIANLAARLREQVRLARLREGHNRALFELSNEIATMLELEQIFSALGKRATLELGRSMRVVPIGSERGDSPPGGGEGGRNAVRGKEHGQERGEARAELVIRASGRALATLESTSAEPQEPLGAEEERLVRGLVSLAGVAAERALLATAAEVARRHAEMQEVRNLLLSSISHDLRTPLTVILGSAASLLEAGQNVAPDTGRLLLEGIASEAQRMSSLLNNILEMTWLESGAVELRTSWNDLEELFAAARAPLAQRLSERGLSVQVQASLPLVECDGGLISQVIGNLLGNALEHTPPGTPIHVTLAASAEEVTLSVRDFGPGIPPGKEDEVFQKFYQAHPEAYRSGMGLGLAICRTILELHGGEVRARNCTPAGAEFWFSLPLSPSPAVLATD